jgi:DNA-binding MarR family transcriptional regulator
MNITKSKKEKMKELFKVFPIENSPGYMLSRMSGELNAILYRDFRASGFEITAQQWAVLSTLWEADGIHQSKIAEKTTKNRHNISEMMKLLERQGFVRREKDSIDKRLLKVSLTESGKALQDKLTPIAKEALRKAFEGLEQQEAEMLIIIYQKVMSNLASRSEQKNH